MTEDESKNVFMSGNAAFIRNWPYLYSICNINESSIKGKFSATSVPAGNGGVSSGVLGGWGIGVNKYSKNIDEAVKFVKYFTSAEAQKYRALKSGNAPNIIALKNDKEILKYDIFKIVNEALPKGFNRPFIQTYPNYNKVSQAFYKMIYKILKKEKTPYAGLEELSKQLQQITGFEIK
jgi:trehalose/maltose transport system substrate-binding protein